MSEVCRILDVARSSVYYGKHHPKRSRVEAKEKELVRRVLLEQNNSFGRRVVRRLLARRGVMLSEYKIGKIFKELGHVSKYGRRKGKNVNTSPHTAEYRKENLLLQLSREQRRRLTIWHMDFTEVKVMEGKEYQCGIVSEGDRILTGLETSSKCTAAFAVETVKKAIAVYGKPDIIHTDRGSQFMSKAFHDMMEAEGIEHSMSRAHTPGDNAEIETFWKSLKTEVCYTEELRREEVKMIARYFLKYYNTERPHSALDYLPPLVYKYLNIVI